MNEQYHKKRQRFMKFGLPSMLLAFTMVCIITFSALSFLTAHSDYKLSEKTAENSARYYEAEQQAFNKLAGLDLMLLQTYEAADDESTYFIALSAMLNAADGKYEVEEKKHYYSFSQNISEKQKLEVNLLLQYPKETKEGFYQIKSWKVTTSDETVQNNNYELADPVNNKERKDE